MTTTTTTRARTSHSAGPAQVSTTVVAVLLVAFGIVGFIPGITTGVSQLTFGGPYSGAYIFDVFQTSVLQNVIHIIMGLAGLGAARGRLTSTLYLAGTGSLFGVFWLYGLMFGNSTYPGNIFPFNLADFSLNIAMAFALIILAAATSQLALIGSKYEANN